MRENGLVVSIDGTAGTGKSSVGKAVAFALGYGFLSTGEMYRALAYKVFEKKVVPEDAQAVLNVANEMVFSFERQPDAKLHVLVDGVYLGPDKLHSEETGNVASKVSTHAQARAVLTAKMREAGAKGGIIMEGRDIGTVVFPDADVKIYLDASAQERANRRFKQLQESGQTPDYDKILASIQERDYRDSHRAASPLKPAPDAVIIDTSDLTLEEVIVAVRREIEKKIPGRAS